MNTFSVILDKLLSALDHRIRRFMIAASEFGLLYDFSDERSDFSINVFAAKLAGLYKTDIDRSFCNEMKQ